MTAATAFTLRPLERNIPHSALEGAFRIHLSVKELRNLGLSQGDLVRLSTPDGPKGFAIAWTATQQNPGNKPIAKVTELLKEKYALSLNDRVFVEKVTQDWKPIEFVDIRFDSSSENVEKYGSTEQLLHWVRYALVDVDLIFPECTFDIQQKGPKSLPKGPKLSATIVSLEPAPNQDKPLYFDPVHTQINLVSGPLALRPSPTTTNQVLQLEGRGIGGLSDHIATINESLVFLTNPAFSFPDRHLIGPTTFLIHGPEGTGKSLLLDRLSECAWKDTFRLDLSSNPKAQARDISETFEKARDTQPSVVIMDDLDKFLAKAESLVARLRSELKKLEGSQVVVAAAARSVYDIDASLRMTSAFKHELEIFPPNVKQREHILKEVVGPDRNVTRVNFSILAERTHGFVGRDIYKLCGLARNRRVRCIYTSLQVGNEEFFGKALQEQDFVAQEDFDAVIGEVQPTVLKDSILEVPKVQWTDIAGLEHVRELLEAIMIRPIKFPDLDIKFGGPQQRKGVLLYGPPGCAKTLIAQAVATESNQNFLAVKGSELIKMYVGESERAIRDVFRRARAAKPCIIFFDEIDSIGKSREKTQDSGLNVVTTLLNEMDGIEALKEVFIIGATNRPDILDSALIRTGRFDAHIHIGLPSEEARQRIFEIHTRKRPLAGDVDLSKLAKSTQGSSGADIKGLCSVAVEMAISDYTNTQNAKQNPEPEIRMEHFERALSKHVPHTVKEEADRYENWRPGKSLSADQRS